HRHSGFGFKVAALLITKFGHPPEKIFIMWSLSRLHPDKADAQHLVLLRPRRDRPRCRAAEERYERAALHRSNHSIISSARQHARYRGMKRYGTFGCINPL